MPNPIREPHRELDFYSYFCLNIIQIITATNEKNKKKRSKTKCDSFFFLFLSTTLDKHKDGDDDDDDAADYKVDPKCTP